MRSADKVRITAQLIMALRSASVGGQLRRDLRDVFSLRMKLRGELRAKSGSTWSLDNRNNPQSARVDAIAHESYLRGISTDQLNCDGFNQITGNYF